MRASYIGVEGVNPEQFTGNAQGIITNDYKYDLEYVEGKKETDS